MLVSKIGSEKRNLLLKSVEKIEDAINLQHVFFGFMFDVVQGHCGGDDYVLYERVKRMIRQGRIYAEVTRNLHDEIISEIPPQKYFINDNGDIKQVTKEEYVEHMKKLDEASDLDIFCSDVNQEGIELGIESSSLTE